MYWRVPSSYLRHCNYDWLNHTTWSNGNCWPSLLYTMWYGHCHLVSGGPGYVWLAEPYHVVQRKLPLYTVWYGYCHLVSGGPGYVWLAEPYHVVPLELSVALKHGIWVNIASFFLHNRDANMLCVGCLMITNTLTYISLYLRNTAILENKKNKFVFSRISLWTLVTFTFTLCKLRKMWADSQ